MNETTGSYLLLGACVIVAMMVGFLFLAYATNPNLQHSHYYTQLPNGTIIYPNGTMYNPNATARATISHKNP